MKKSFSLMEVIIAISLLSVVMLSLLQVKSDNIYLLKSSQDKSLLNDYILMAIDSKSLSNRNENLFLGNKFNFNNDDIRNEFKDKKVKIVDNEEDFFTIDNEYIKVNISTLSTTYNLEDEKISKKIYSFKISL